MGVVVLGHVALAVWLSFAMMPPAPVQRSATESMMIVELIDLTPVAEPESDPETETPPDGQLPVLPDLRPPAPIRRQAVPMQAVIEPSEASPAEPEPAREYVAPERDPFHRPSAPAANRGFGRRDRPALSEPNRPRLAGEAPPGAPIPEQQIRQIGTKEIVEGAAVLLGLGGPDAPAEAPCGGRMSGGFGTADSFSPNWQGDHGCGDRKQAAGYDGRVELPPGVAGEPDR